MKRIFIASVQSEFAGERLLLKNYFENNPQVELYSNRLTVSNPGTINPTLTPAKLRVRHRSYPNNPRIAEPFYQTRYIDRIGSGITDLIGDCRKAGLRDPDYEITPYEVVVTIWRPNPARDGVADGPVSDTSSDTLNDTSNDTLSTRIMGLVSRRPGIRAPEIMKSLDVSRSTIARCIRNNLKNSIVFKGSKKTGGYYPVGSEK